MDILSYLFDYRYWAIFIGTFVEGPIVITLVGFLIRLGVFRLIPSYFLLLLGNVAADVFWYYVGHYGAKKAIRKFGRFFGLKQEIVKGIKKLFHEHQVKILFLSKVTMGFGLTVPIMITAGVSKIPIKRIILINFFGGFIWTAFLLAMGYFFGNIYLLISEEYQKFFIPLIIFFIVAIYVSNRIFRRRLLK